METTRKVEHVSFKIDMEFVCNLARTWLWDEDKPYEVCEEVLLEMMGGNDLTLEEKKQIALQILEGRKIIKGINSGTLEDDGELIRPIHTLANKYKKKLKSKELETHIDCFPWMYVDTFCGGCSITNSNNVRGFKDYDRIELINWRKYGIRKNNKDFIYKDCTDPLECGTLLLSQHFFAEKVLGEPCKDADEVMIKLTNYYNNQLEQWKQEGIDYSIMGDYQKRVYERNLYACKEYKLIFPYSNPYGESDLPSKGLDYNELSLKKENQKFEEISDNIICDKNLANWYTHVGVPDRKLPEFSGQYLNKYGWIDIDGNWYSCSFGGHSAKAFNIVRQLKLGNQYRDYCKENHTRGEEIYLESLGWIKFHNPSMYGEPYVDSNRKLNFSQKNILMDIEKQFNLDIYSKNNNENDYYADKW